MIRTIQNVILLSVLPLFAQITVQINSGDPASPFPQFQPYSNPADTLGNLATHNAVGVSHAEMEKSIREAYQIMMNRASYLTDNIGGKKFIQFKSAPQCSEGDGYALLAAAAMADKETFDGLWLYIHDVTMHKVKRYSDCKWSDSAYSYSPLPGWMGAGANSAADGDFDIALALVSAYRQWGEFMGIDDKCGNPISYKQAAIDFLNALTDTLVYSASGTGLLSGDIGLDGYIKGGDSWEEMTGWAKNSDSTGFTKPAQGPGPATQHFDYAAPAYFTQFADFLSAEDSSRYAWNIYQFRRAAASSDWIMGQLLPDEKKIPFAGDVTISSANNVTFAEFSDGEDFRLPWRTILNYVWNGNPSSTWDPATHQAKSGTPNTFEHDIGQRYARFLWNTHQAPWNNTCENVASAPATYWGPSVLKNRYSLTGEPTGTFVLNWVPGAGSPSAVASQNTDLMAELYRQCEILWDTDTPGDGYLTSVPKYFQGWFRQLGMLVLSGNYTSPMRILPAANMKVYCDVDKTCASPGEEVTYTLSYRNYGSADASGVVISDAVPAGMSFVSGSEGAVYTASSNIITWNIGTVPGFKTATGITPTTGTVSFKVKIADATMRQCANRAVVTCGNGTGWTSNEYPNTVSAVMKRNYVDIIPAQQAASDGTMQLPSLHGGRPGVRFTCSFDKEKSSSMRYIRVRMYNDAEEAYIDYGNYRVSCFISDTVTENLQGDTGTAIFRMNPTIVEGIDKNGIIFRQEKLTPLEDGHGKWNRRMIIQFGNPETPQHTESLVTTTNHLCANYGMGAAIHRGGTMPLRFVAYLYDSGFRTVQWDDDWSWNADAVADDASTGFPVTPDFTDPSPDNPGVPVNSIHPKACETSDTTVDNILIEEWDGYVWRKVFGNAPQLAVPAVAVLPAMRTAPSVSLRGMHSLILNIPAAGNVRVQMLDISGRVIATPVDGYRAAGTHCITLSGQMRSAGVRVIRLKTESGDLFTKQLMIR